MKGRFCIFRHGVRSRSIERCDNVWKTCTLHNILFLIDGHYKNWESGACCNWEIINDNYEKRNQGKVAKNHLNNPSVGHRENKTVQDNDCNLNAYEVNNAQIVRKMPIEIFQVKLIEHFDMRFKRNAIKWPSRCKTKSTT